MLQTVTNTEKKCNIKFKVLQYIAIASAITAVLALLIVIGFLLIRGIPNLSFQLLFGEYDVLEDKISLLPALVGTLYLIVLTLVMSIPLGVAAAIYLQEYIKKGNQLVKAINIAIDTLSGIPSIIFGLFGALFFVQTLGLKLSAVSGALTLSLINLPVIIRSVQESLLAVPQSYREGSMALGVGKVKTIFKVVLPSAMPGIITAVILSVGRIVGESAAILWTAGSSPINVPTSIFQPSPNLAVAVYYFSMTNERAASATGVILLLFVIAFNVLSTWIGNRLQKKLTA